MSGEKIEILSLDIFDTHVAEMKVVEQIQKYFKHGLGWHYWLDLAWLIKEVSTLPKGSLILDAGAGSGMTQFILAELGYNVISADFANRSFSKKHLDRYGPVLHYLNDQDEVFDTDYTRHLEKTYSVKVGEKQKRGVVGSILDLLRGGPPKSPQGGSATSIIEANMFKPIGSGDNGYAKILGDNVTDYCGRVFIYKCDLKKMALLPDGYVDGVVSVSALEHNNHEDLEKCVTEIMRVTKPGGKLTITVSASQEEDWFHEPSKGWCYSDPGLRKLFRLSPDVPSNYSKKEEYYRKFSVEDNELHKRLAPFYFKSGDNGMPWGKWDPQYQPVGLVKIKE